MRAVCSIKMYTLILSVVVAIVLCEAAGAAKSYEGCDELEKCADPHSFETENFESVGVFSDDEKYKQLCHTINTDLQSCYAKKKNYCDNDYRVNVMSGKAHVLNYLCSPEGRKGLASLYDSPCVTDKTVLLVAQQRLRKSQQENIKNFKNDESNYDFCSFFYKVSGTFTSTISTPCGKDYASFSKKLWDISMKPIASKMGCEQQVT